MTTVRQHISGARVRWIVGTGLAVAFAVQCHSLISSGSKPTRTPGFGVTAAVAKQEPVRPVSPEELSLDDIARHDPLKLLHEARKRYDESIIDYTCVFRKKELLNGKLTHVQGAKVKFRDKGDSVFMHWFENPDKARRVIYVEDKWNKGGKPAALCEPEGAIARMLVSSIAMPIHGPDAKAASRRTIDQFGFEKALDLIIKYSEMAKENGELELSYIGQAKVGGRETYVFERLLPYTGEDGVYPDRLLVYHLDKETLMPLSCASYADEKKEQLLGRYEYTDVKLNVGLSEADFEGKTYKM